MTWATGSNLGIPEESLGQAQGRPCSSSMPGGRGVCPTLGPPALPRPRQRAPAGRGAAPRGGSSLGAAAGRGDANPLAWLMMALSTRMFYRATSFNGDIGGWNTAEVTNMAMKC